MNSRFLTIVAFLTSWPAVGQMAPLGGPVSGLIFDAPSRSVRPIIGVPGSSYLGQALLENIDNAFIAPDGESALVVANTQVLLIRRLRSGNPARLPVSGLGHRVDYVSWVPNSA